MQVLPVANTCTPRQSPIVAGLDIVWSTVTHEWIKVRKTCGVHSHSLLRHQPLSTGSVAENVDWWNWMPAQQVSLGSWTEGLPRAVSCLFLQMLMHWLCQGLASVSAVISGDSRPPKFTAAFGTVRPKRPVGSLTVCACSTSSYDCTSWVNGENTKSSATSFTSSSSSSSSSLLADNSPSFSARTTSLEVGGLPAVPIRRLPTRHGRRMLPPLISWCPHMYGPPNTVKARR